MKVKTPRGGEGETTAGRRPPAGESEYTDESALLLSAGD